LIEYRQAKETDTSAMAQIRSKEWGAEEYWKTRIELYMRGEHDPQKALKPRMLYVALQNSAVVGFIAGHLTRRYECDGELQWINIMAEERKTGIASALLRLLAQWFVSQHAFKICVDVDPENIVARNFYIRHGATELNRHWLVWNDVRSIEQE